jgi:hypothetical protein
MMVKRTGALMAALLMAALALVGVATTPAQAATSCGAWHIISYGQTGKAITVGADSYLYPVGGADYWNQQVQFCHDPLWTADHYAIHSNRGGGYWTTKFTVSPFNEPPVCSCSSQIYNTHELFAIDNFDGNFWTIRSVATGRYLTGTSPITLDHSGFKNGTNLFLISPRNLS